VSYQPNLICLIVFVNSRGTQPLIQIPHFCWSGPKLQLVWHITSSTRLC